MKCEGSNGDQIEVVTDELGSEQVSWEPPVLSRQNADLRGKDGHGGNIQGSP